jgi:hypothetical protein
VIEGNFIAVMMRKKKYGLVEHIIGFCKALVGSFMAWLWNNGINLRLYQE